ncbi:hypothetical protein DK853_38210 [Klebsiella oxytoca]|nr:hypothetical protein DK853_38210 [Klebsiella oxytoca]
MHLLICCFLSPILEPMQVFHRIQTTEAGAKGQYMLGKVLSVYLVIHNIPMAQLNMNLKLL